MNDALLAEGFGYSGCALKKRTRRAVRRRNPNEPGSITYVLRLRLPFSSRDNSRAGTNAASGRRMLFRADDGVAYIVPLVSATRYNDIQLRTVTRVIALSIIEERTLRV